ncbi:MAG: Nif11-like leader peptide family natural product precursor [Pseudomonadota bacterium]
MAAAIITDFFDKVRANPDAVARLSGCANSDEFVDRAVTLGRELGYSVQRDDLFTALRAANPGASDLSDDELDHVQAAGVWEALLRAPVPAP